MVGVRVGGTVDTDAMPGAEPCPTPGDSAPSLRMTANSVTRITSPSTRTEREGIQSGKITGCCGCGGAGDSSYALENGEGPDRPLRVRTANYRPIVRYCRRVVNTTCFAFCIVTIAYIILQLAKSSSITPARCRFATERLALSMPEPGLNAQRFVTGFAGKLRTARRITRYSGESASSCWQKTP